MDNITDLRISCAWGPLWSDVEIRQVNKHTVTKPKLPLFSFLGICTFCFCCSDLRYSTSAIYNHNHFVKEIDSLSEAKHFIIESFIFNSDCLDRWKSVRNW